MKISIKNLLSAAAIGSVVLFVASACGDKATFDAVTAADGARVKFLHAVQGGTPVVVFANNKKWSARLNSVAYGPDSLVYGDVYPSIDYSVFTAGETTFDIKTTAAAAVVSSKVTLESGKYYTLIATDTLPSPKTLLITDDRSTIKSDKKTYVRFVNVVAGGSATGYDFILRRQGVSTTLSTLKGGEAGAVVELDPYPLTNTVNDSLLIRVPGATTNFVALNLSTTGLSANRLRTFVLRGKAASPGVNTILNN